ncbi:MULTISPECIES: allene oxide cyclase family protein [unclassified Mycolicibacterium]|uniref:allene oxide cyclase family protein n=1 Tax=unclassified Mycolicibacterium TaxID=2636767 RepID=UPI002ED97612
MRPNAVPSLMIAVAALGGVAVATSAAATADPGTVTVIEHATTDTVTDLGTKGDSVGDLLTFSNEVFDAADGQPMGKSTGVCTRTVVGVEWDCGWTLSLADGQITVQGPFFDAADSVLSITGGTGRYFAARGEMALAHITPDGSKYQFTYRLG